jgi:hypothetical protein
MRGNKPLTDEDIQNLKEGRLLGEEFATLWRSIDWDEAPKSFTKIADFAKDGLKTLNEVGDATDKQNKAAVLSLKYATTSNVFARIFYGLRVKTLSNSDIFTRSLKSQVAESMKFKELAKEVNAELEQFADYIGDGLKNATVLNEVFDNIGQTIGEAITNPITIATAALLSFNSQQVAIADQFGAMGVTEFRDELVETNKEFTKLGYTSEQSQTAISDLSNDFGIAFSEADNLASITAETAKATGQTLENSTKLIGVLTTSKGLSGEQANELIRSTQALAKANNVAPDKILEDIANNTEAFAKFSKDGGENILRAAIQARKLGLSLDKVASVSEGLLNFQDSLNNEVEASVLIGRQLNFQKARELALANDIEGATAAVVQQLGSAAEFNKLNAIQRQALADSVGLEVSELERVVNKEKEAATLQGELAKTKIDDIVSEKAITSTAELINNLKVIGITIGESIGPVINVLAKALSGIVKIMGDFTTIPVIAFLGLWAAKTTITTAATVANSIATLKNTFAKMGSAKATAAEAAATAAETGATVANTGATGVNTTVEAANTVAKTTKLGILGTLAASTYVYATSVASATAGVIASTIAAGANVVAQGAVAVANFAVAGASAVAAAATYMFAAAEGAAASLGIGTPAFVMMAVAAIAAMGLAIAGAYAMVGDIDSPATGKTTVSTKEGGLFQLSANDDLLAAPGLSAAVNGMGGSAVVNTTDTSKMENQQAASNEKLDRMVSVLEGALAGPRPALARAMGSQVGDTVGGMA